MAKLNIEVNGVSETVQKLRDGIEDGSIEGLDDVLDLGKETARSEVQQKRRPYTTPHLVGSFETAIDSAQRKGRIYNLLEYSAYVDKGVSGTQRKVPGSPFSYTDTMPPLDEMIKFVEERMGSWSLSDFDPPSGGDSASAGGNGGDGDEGGDGSADDAESPETGSEGASYAEEWRIQDPITDADDNVYRIAEEDEERGGYLLQRGAETRFVDYRTAAAEYDHTPLDADLDITDVENQETYENLLENLAVEREVDNSNPPDVSEGDVLRYNSLGGKDIFGFVAPEELQNSGDGVVVINFAEIDDFYDRLSGQIVNRARYKNSLAEDIAELFFDDGENEILGYFPDKELRNGAVPSGEVTEDKLAEAGNVTKREYNLTEVGDDFDITSLSNQQTIKYEQLSDPQSRIRTETVRGTRVDSSGKYIKTIRGEQEVGNDIKLRAVGSLEPENIEKGDELLIDGGETSIPEWNDDGILVEATSELGTERIEVYDSVADVTANIHAKEIITTRKEQPGPFEVKDLDSKDIPARIKFNGTDGIEREGYIESYSEKGDDNTLESAVDIRYIEDDKIQIAQFASIDVELGDVVSVEEIRPEKNKSYEPESFNQDWIKGYDSQPDHTEFSLGDTLLIEDKYLDETVVGEVIQDNKNDVILDVGSDTALIIGLGQRLYEGNDKDRVQVKAKLVEKNFVSGRVSEVPTTDKDLPSFFYGQEVVFEFDGKNETAVIDGWTDNYITVSGTDKVDKISVTANFEVENTAKLQALQPWQSLRESEKKKRLIDGIRYNTNINTANEDFVSQIADRFENVVESKRDIDNARALEAMLLQIDSRTSRPAAGTFAPFPTNDRKPQIKKYDPDKMARQGRLELSLERDGVFQDIESIETTFYHEMEHAFMGAHGYGNDANALTSAYSPGTGSQYVDMVWNRDGTLASMDFTDVPSKNSPDGNEELIEVKQLLAENPIDGNDKTYFNDNDFKGIDADGVSLDKNEAESLDYDDSVTFTEIFDKDVETEAGDVLKVEEDIFGSIETRYYQMLETESEKTRLYDIETNTIKLIKAPSTAGFTSTGLHRVDEDTSGFEGIDGGYTIDSSDPLDRYTEAANRAVKARLWAVSDTNQDVEGPLSEIRRAYTGSNTNETWAVMAELFQGDKRKRARNIVPAYRNYPYLVEAYLDVNNPRGVSRDIIKEEDELEPLRKYL